MFQREEKRASEAREREAKAAREAAETESGRVVELQRRVECDLRAVQTLLWESRAAFLRRTDKRSVIKLLSEANKLAVSVDAQLAKEGSALRRTTLAKLGYTEDVFSAIAAHTMYHTAAAHLHEEGGDAAASALSLLQEARARLLVSGPAANNEMARTTIKMGDAFSRQRNVEHALQQYSEVVPSDAQLLGEGFARSAAFESFWVVRAVNNRAVVRFGLGRDIDALEDMRVVVGLAERWLHAREVTADAVAQWWGDGAREGELAASVTALNLHTKRALVTPPLLALINLGADDAVDVLHLPFPAALRSARPAKLTADDVLAPDGHPQPIAIEYLERSKLMLRKYITSRANVLLFACAPFSNALRDDKGNLRVDELLASVDAALATPLGLPVYLALDAQWVAAEGTSRVCAAVGWALTELLAANAVPPEAVADVRFWADRLTATATRVVHHSPEVHICIATLARARFLQVYGGGPSAALDLLTDRCGDGNTRHSILQWSAAAQRRARAQASEQLEAGALRATAGVPPRHARWQISTLAQALSLRLALKQPLPADEVEALTFAVEPCNLKLSHNAHLPLARAVAAVHAAVQSPRDVPTPPSPPGFLTPLYLFCAGVVSGSEVVSTAPITGMAVDTPVPMASPRLLDAKALNSVLTRLPGWYEAWAMPPRHTSARM